MVKLERILLFVFFLPFKRFFWQSKSQNCGLMNVAGTERDYNAPKFNFTKTVIGDLTPSVFGDISPKERIGSNKKVGGSC